jgi:ATP phosphoribosyltransferase regulatory subunit
LQTFKLVDQISGRMLGLRADSTPQVARIDAHLLNRKGVARLCYCGPVLHTRPAAPHATREPLQLGAEIYGHQGLEADLEILTLALDCLRAAKVQDFMVDLADVRIVNSLLSLAALSPAETNEIQAALAVKDAAAIATIARRSDAAVRLGLQNLTRCYGDVQVLSQARSLLPDLPAISQALDQLQWLAGHLEGTTVSFDLADLRGYAYYSGARFAVYAKGAPDALLRGGRYDAVGSVFGRERPAVGFSLDIKALVGVLSGPPLRAAIRAPWGEDKGLRSAIAKLRSAGETVVCVLPGHESEIDEFHCDRVLVARGSEWHLVPV